MKRLLILISSFNLFEDHTLSSNKSIIFEEDSVSLLRKNYTSNVTDTVLNDKKITLLLRPKDPLESRRKVNFVTQQCNLSYKIKNYFIIFFNEGYELFHNYI